MIGTDRDPSLNEENHYIEWLRATSGGVTLRCRSTFMAQTRWVSPRNRKLAA